MPSPLEGFHPAVRAWFEARFGEPSPPQREGWPAIREGRHTLIAAPTGTGKTLAAFLWAIDRLLRKGTHLGDATEVLYVSPLKALGNDVQINLQEPLSGIRGVDPSLPGIRVLVRSGDTLPAARASMARRHPHILVTTPESLYVLLTSASGRAILSPVRTVIVDEIHAVAGGKRGSHLALSLERLEALTGGGLQRIGLSATQRPLEATARLLAGAGRDCAVVDVGHRRGLDLAVEIPDAPLETVCSHETWGEIHHRMAGLIREHRTTLVFVNTRKLAERTAARLTEILGPGQVTSHHGSLARDRRLEAERRLKAGELRALVATASLELGIDIGDVDLVVQAGVTPSISTLLQRIGRAGHALSRTPKGRLFPLTRDELVCAAALLEAVRRGDLDRTEIPAAPLDILAQQIVAACVAETWDEEALFAALTRAWPYRDLPRRDFDAVVRLHAEGRSALLHRDGVGGRLRATRRARLAALTGGGAIPDTADYKVVLEPEGTPIGSVHEDFAIESFAGDIFQLGNASWRILKVEPGLVRVADARGAPPTLPFWIAEGPSRTRELSAAISRIRLLGRDPAALARETGLAAGATRQIADYLEEGIAALGAAPTQERVIVERFFDEAGGMQLVIHAPFGGRINRAWGLALRKRFCRGFGFELQAAANEEAIVLSLGPQHSFPLEDVLDFLHPRSVRDVLVQALLPSPMFAARWRWNATRSLILARTGGGGRRVPAPLLRMRADDLLARAFPEVLACGETLPPGDLPVPWEHPIVRQTVEDALHEAMDLDGLIEVLEGLRSGRIERIAVDTPEPSAFARGILNAAPYAFLDDAPLEERRTQAVLSRRALDPRTADTLGALDPAAVAAVREEAWPRADSAEEVHEALQWMGYVTAPEADASGWTSWLEELRAAGRTAREGERWLAAETARAPLGLLRGRMEALGPVVVAPGPAEADGDAKRSPGGRFEGPAVIPRDDEPLLLDLEREGTILRCRIGGRQAWCDRRLLARIQRRTLDRLRREIEPVPAGVFWRFLAAWQHVGEESRLEGPRGVLEVVRQLAGFEIAAASWETSILPARVRGYRPEFLDRISLSGEVAWGRLWGIGNSAVRATPIALLPREDLDRWLRLAGLARSPAPPRAAGLDGEPPPPLTDPLSGRARVLLEALHKRGALFTRELAASAGPLSDHLEMGLSEMIARGLVTCDSFAGLRRLLRPPHRRRADPALPASSPAGRWSVFRSLEEPGGAGPGEADEGDAEFALRVLLQRYGVVFKRLMERERLPVPWREIVRAGRRLELKGEIRGGRFVQGFAGEQFALPGAVDRLRREPRDRPIDPLDAPRGASPSGGEPHGGGGPRVAAGDPLNLAGILTPDPRIPSAARRKIPVG